MQIFSKTGVGLVLSIALGLTQACTSLSAEEGHQTKRDTLVDQYVLSLNECDPSSFGELMDDAHQGYAVKGVLDRGFNAEALRKQCDAGFRMSVQPASVTWTSQPQDRTQIVSFDLLGTLSHPERGTNSNNLRVTLVASLGDDETLKIRHSHISPMG